MNQPQPIYLNFNAATVEPQVPFEALPAGDYLMALTGARVMETKARTGHYLAMDYTVLDGQYKGRHVFDNLNLWNASQQASEIAWRQLSGLCHAAGVLQVQTVDQLFNIPVLAKLGIESDPQYGDSNNIRGFTSASGPQPGAPAQPAAPGAAPAPGAPQQADDLPWGPGTQQSASAPTSTPASPAAAPAQGAKENPPWLATQQAQTQGSQETPPWQR